MPKKRFAKLEADKQIHILEEAGKEFAAYGFAGASFNRIIAASGVSKGAMYYYFEDKADLYATVVTRLMQRYLESLGPLPTIATAEDFWSLVEDQYLEGVRFYEKVPYAAALSRTVLTEAIDGSDGMEALAEVRGVIRTWMQGMVSLGQAVGAVRTDMPFELLVGSAVALAEAFDIWFAHHGTHLTVAEREAIVQKCAAMYRRLGAPEEST